MIEDEKFKLTVFTIYTIIYEAAVWGLWAYLFIALSISGWTILIAIVMSGAQLKPRHFGLPYKTESCEG